jgi:tetratricopeptide (TPR) repeat protein
LVAALFGWHPQHVESVAWIAERKDVLSTFFALLALLSYTRFAQTNCRRSFWLAGLGFALGLLAKPMVVTLPFVLLLLDFWPLRRMADFRMNAARTRELASLIIEKWVFFLLAAISCATTYLAQSQVVQNAPAIASLEAVSLGYRLKNVPVAYVEYLGKLCWPSKLAIYYPMPETISGSAVLAALALLGGISWIAWRQQRSQPYLLLGWLWFLGMLVPVIGLVKAGDAGMADRYSYLPSVGIFIMVAFAASAVLDRFPATKPLFATGAGVILAGCLFATENYLPVWQNSETLFRHALRVTPDNDVARNNLANALRDQGKLAEALIEYRAAIKCAPERDILHGNLGIILDQLHRPAEALAAFREALRLQPDNASNHNLAGGQLLALGRLDEALKEFAIAEKLAPELAWPQVGLANGYFKLGRDVEAVDKLRAAVRLAPDDYQVLALSAHFLAVNENATARDGRTALILAAKANALTGGTQPMVFDIIGMACAEVGDFTNAQMAAQSAIDLVTRMQMKGTEPIQQRLELYRQHQPWRESFLATNSPTQK